MSVWGKSETFFVIGKRISAVKGGGGRAISLTDHERLPGKDSHLKSSYSDSFYLLEKRVNNAFEVAKTSFEFWDFMV